MKRKAVFFFRENNEKIMSIWEKKVKKEIDVSDSTTSLLLRNQLPYFIKDIAKIFDRYKDLEEMQDDEGFEEIIQDSSDHGRHRASAPNYTVKQVLQEYMVFHRTITDLLIEDEAYSKEVATVLKYIIETAMIQSANSFTQSLQDMREKVVGTLAHDLRNPLSAAYLAIDTLEYEHGQERFRKMKRLIRRSVKNSLNLVEGLLDSISIEAGEGMTIVFEETNLMEDIDWVYQEASEIYKNPIELVSEAKEIKGVFDAAAIRRVLENLISNGVKYGAEDSRITITVVDKTQDVLIKVHNEGLPISKERQKEIFHFLETKKKENAQMKSWGMGLYLVKMVVEAHGGELNLQSSEEEGTTFEMILGKYTNEIGKSKTRVNIPELSSTSPNEQNSL